MAKTENNGISIKGMGYDPKTIRKLVEGREAPTFLARITGIATSFITGVTKKGEWIGFKGQFAAVNADGEIFEADTVFLPKATANNVKAALDAGSEEVAVKTDVYVQESEKNPSGYAFVSNRQLTDEAKQKAASLKADMMQGLPEGVTVKASKKKVA